MSIGNPSVRVSTATRRQHWRTDKEEKRAPIPRLIRNDGHANWDRSYYDFGHYNADCLEGRLNFKSRYPIILTPKRMEKI